MWYATELAKEVKDLRNKTLIPVLAWAFAPLAVVADESPNWTYIDATWVSTELSVAQPGNEDLTGWEVMGTWQFHDLAYLRGAYSSQEESVANADFDLELDTLSLGIGGIWSLNPSTDLYGGLSFEDWDFQGFSVEEDDTGYRAEVGIRSMVWRGLELNAEAGYLDVGDVVDGDDFFELGAVYTFQNGLGLGMSYGEVSDLNSFRVNVRYTFR